MSQPFQSSNNSSSSSLDAIQTPDFTGNTSCSSSSATSIHEETLNTGLSCKTPPLSSTSLTSALDDMIRIEGGGSWPPRPTYRSSWPQCLHIYDTVARQCPPRFVTPEIRPSYSDVELRKRIDGNRNWLEQSLSSVDVKQILTILPELDHKARLGYLACMAYLNHLYRWGTLPVVAMAQDENLLNFPDTVALPFRWLNDFYGIKTTGGCLFSMTFVNMVDDGVSTEVAYSNMRHMPMQSVVDAERYNALVFYEMERISFTLYRSIASCQTLMAIGQEQEAADALKQGNIALKAAFKLFFETLKEEKLKKSVWMSHAQGFHGWGVNDFDGVSGDHSLLIRTLDAFLGVPLRKQPLCTFATATIPSRASSEDAHIRPPRVGRLAQLYDWLWPSPHSSTSAPASVSCVGRMKQIMFSEIPYSNEYLPREQVKWIQSVREAGLREKASPDSPIAAEINEMVKTFKLWRMGHTRRAVYYEDLHLPERKPMTASGGVGGGVTQGSEGLPEMIEKLEARLRARVAATQ